MYESAIYKEINEVILDELAELYKKAFDDFKKDELILEYFFGLGEKPDIKLASLSIVANAIMNLDEFLTHGWYK